MNILFTIYICVSAVLLVIALGISIFWVVESNTNYLSSDERKFLRWSVIAIPLAVIWPLVAVIAVPAGLLYGSVIYGKTVIREWNKV